MGKVTCRPPIIDLAVSNSTEESLVVFHRQTFPFREFSHTSCKTVQLSQAHIPQGAPWDSHLNSLPMQKETMSLALERGMEWPKRQMWKQFDHEAQHHSRTSVPL